MAQERNITVISTPSKLVDVILASDGSNFSEWRFLIKVNLDGMGKGDHLEKECPTDNTLAVEWKNTDKALLSRIINCIDRKIILSMQHCQTVKEVWELVNKWFSGTSNLRKLYQLSQEVYRSSQKGRELRDYYYDFKSVCVALCAAMPITNDVDEMKKQRDKLLVFSWISGLDKEYDVLRSQLLGNKDLESLDQVFSMLQNASGNNDSNELQERNVLISQGGNTGENYGYRGGGNNHFRGRGGFFRGRGGRGGPRVCFNCGDPGHFRNQCPKPPRQQVAANMASMSEGHKGVMTDEEFAKFNQMKLSFSSQSPSNQASSSATFIQTGNPVACVSSASRQWVIDSGASEHMTGSFDAEDYW